MAFNIQLADRVREYLHEHSKLKIEEKKMFRGLAFLVNGKMCVNVSGESLMCRFSPEREEEVADRAGFEPMIMKGKQLKGYCYVREEGFKSKTNFAYWINLCLEFNEKAKSSKKKK